MKAFQDQAISINNKKHDKEEDILPIFRLYGYFDETISHIVSVKITSKLL